MTEQQRRVHNAYNRAYYAQHRDRILQNKRNNREARNAYMRKYRAANYEKLSAYYSDRRRKKSRDTAHEILFERAGVSGDLTPCGEAGERPAGDAEAGAAYAVRIRGGL